MMTWWLTSGFPRQFWEIVGKEAVLGAVPFAGAGRQMGDGYNEAGLVGKALQFTFPGADAGTVAAAAIGPNGQGWSLGIASLPRPISLLAAFSSATPRLIVLRASPLAPATAVTPPRPSDIASLPANSRRPPLSSRNGDILSKPSAKALDVNHNHKISLCTTPL